MSTRQIISHLGNFWVELFINRILAVTYVVVALLAILYHFNLEPFAYNPTASLPTGIYWHTSGPLRRWTIVALAQPPGIRPLHLPFGKHSLLFKAIAGLPGDTVTESTMGVWINGRRWPNSEPSSPLDHPYMLGSLVVRPGYVWVMGTNRESFDARYFGEVLISSIKYHARPRPLFGIPANQLCAVKDTDPSPSPCYLRQPSN
jgi:conjugative transfer signal peptidase TraF